MRDAYANHTPLTPLAVRSSAQALGQHSECVASYEAAVSVYRDVVGAEHLSTAAALGNLGLAFKAKAATSTGMERVRPQRTEHGYHGRSH